MDRSKAARVWKRTVVGLLLIGAVSLLLALAAGESGVHLLAGVSAACALWCLFELDRMAGSVSRAATFAQLVVLAVLFGWAWYPRADGGTLGVPVGSTPALVALSLTGAAFVAALLVLVAAKLFPSRPSAGLPGTSAGVSGPSAGLPGTSAGLPLGFVALRMWVLTAFILGPLLRVEYGINGLIALIVLSKIGDIAGYYVGNAIGRKHPFPSISPGKTVAGCVGSLVAGVVFGGLLHQQGLLPAGRLGPATGFVAGGLLNLAAQAGDLLESWVKRRAGVKDSGSLFGPAGGALDLMDSLLLTIPAAVLTWPLLFE